MKQKNNRFFTISAPYFVVLTCLVAYIIFIISDVREKDIPDAMLTIYSLVVSSALVLLGKIVDGNRNRGDDDDEEENSDLENKSKNLKHDRNI